MNRHHEPQFRQISARLVTVTCKCGWVRERISRRRARESYEHHENLHRPQRHSEQTKHPAEHVLDLMTRIADDLGIRMIGR